MKGKYKAMMNQMKFPTRRGFCLTWLVVAFVSIALDADPLSAQGSNKEEDPRLKARPITLQTKDGMELQAYYFPSDQKKAATTVLLVHEWQGQAGTYAKLASALNKAGCAVLALDYRGHGKSSSYVNARGDKIEIDPEKLSRKDAEAIVTLDLEKAKAFLKDENNDGYLNLNALVVIGVGEGCVLGNLWAMRDWSFPSVGRVKQGQDVKGLVLISPEKQVKGLPLEPSLNDNNLLQLPTLIMAGKTSSDASEARRIESRIAARKKKVGRGEVTGLSLELLDSNLSGASLVSQADGAIKSIVSFVTTEVKGNARRNPWVERD